MKAAGAKTRFLALMAPLLLAAACTTQSPGVEEGLGFAGQPTTVASTQLASDTSTETSLMAATSESGAPIPVPTPSPNAVAATDADPALAPAFAPADGGTESAQKLVQVASLSPSGPLPGVAESVGAAPAAFTYPDPQKRSAAFLSREHECLARAMFFESNRSSRDGLIAVGSVVMNRLEDGRWGSTVCDVVGAPRQFAPGVLSRSMDSAALPDVMEAAQSVLKGERHPKIYKNVMFFHTAGYRYPYDNMHYVVVAGGNSFYEKRRRMRGMNNTPQSAVLASAGQMRVAAQDTPLKRAVRRAAKQKQPTIDEAVPVPAVAIARPLPVQPAAFAPASEPSADRFGGPVEPTSGKSGRMLRPVLQN
ncbi:MAG: cell wall hydrolase [Rhizobiaceae bacterium]